MTEGQRSIISRTKVGAADDARVAVVMYGVTALGQAHLAAAEIRRGVTTRTGKAIEQSGEFHD